MSAVAEHLLLQLCASKKVERGSLDVRTAFLTGDYVDRSQCMETPADLRKELHLASNEVLKLRKDVYDLVNAPKEWFKRLQRDVSSRHWVSKLPRWTVASTGYNELTGMACTALWECTWTCCPEVVTKLLLRYFLSCATIFKFGSAEVGRFTCRGRQVVQQAGGSIEVDAEAYRQAVQAVPIPRERREQPDAPLTRNEIGQLRSGRALQWLATRGAPDLAYETGFLQSRVADGTVRQTWMTLNKVSPKSQQMTDLPQ